MGLLTYQSLAVVWVVMLYLIAHHVSRLLELIAPRAPRGWTASSAAAERAAGLVYDHVGRGFFLWPGYWEWRWSENGKPRWLVRPEGSELGYWVSPKRGYIDALEELERIKSLPQGEKFGEATKIVPNRFAPLARHDQGVDLPQTVYPLGSGGALEDNSWYPTNEKGNFYQPTSHKLGIMCSDGQIREQFEAKRFEEALNYKVAGGTGVHPCLAPGHMYTDSPYCDVCGEYNDLLDKPYL